VSAADLVEQLRDPAARIWVDIDANHPGQHALLEKVFDFHPLAIEDTLNPKTRVKVDAYDAFLFVTMRAVTFCETTEEDPYDLETSNLYFFIGRNYLVTVHSTPSPAVNAVIDLVTANPDLMNRSVGRLAHLIMDQAVDGYFPILDQVDEFVDGLEARVFERFDQGAIQDIFRVKRLVLGLRRFLMPQREIFNVLTNRPTPFITPEEQVYFRDVYDHMLRIGDSLENYRELLSGTMDSYLTQVSNRLGSVTKGLSVVATMSVPFVVVSGMWGMNFARIPLAEHPHGFLIMLVAQLAMGLGLLALLRRMRLL
jgi:magnesium transporter